MAVSLTCAREGRAGETTCADGKTPAPRLIPSYTNQTVLWEPHDEYLPSLSRQSSSRPLAWGAWAAFPFYIRYHRHSRDIRVILVPLGTVYQVVSSNSQPINDQRLRMMRREHLGLLLMPIIVQVDRDLVGLRTEYTNSVSYPMDAPAWKHCDELGSLNSSSRCGRAKWDNPGNEPLCVSLPPATSSDPSRSQEPFSLHPA